jgi:hypothetical protein
MSEQERLKRIRRRLGELCDAVDASDRDLGGWPTRLAAVSAAIGMAAALGACYGGPPPAMMPPDSPDSVGAGADPFDGLPEAPPAALTR